MTFYEVLEQVRELLQRHGRMSYRALKRQFELDDAYLDDLRAELVEVQRVAVDQDGTMLVWTGDASAAQAPPAPAPAPERAPRAHMPAPLTAKILAATPRGAPAARGPTPGAGARPARLHAGTSHRQDPRGPRRPGRRAQAGHRALCR